MKGRESNHAQFLVLPFVWHVSYIANDFKIARNGIQPGRKGYVHVNNHCHSLKTMWPLPIDLWDYMDETEDVYMTHYTFWRIDTALLTCDWEIDESLHDESVLHDLLERTNYIQTRSAIPSSAIRPFKYAQDKVPSLDINEHDGVPSIEGLTQGLPLILEQGLLDWMNG